MQMLIRKGFNIKQLDALENQNFKGYCSNAQSYRVNYSVESGEEKCLEMEIVGTLNDVVPVGNKNEDTGAEAITDYALTFYPIWKEDGPVDEHVTVLLSQINKMSQIYINFKTSYKPFTKDQREREGESFVFYLNDKSTSVYPGDFVKIAYRKLANNLMKGETPEKSVFGRVVSVTNGYVTLQTVAGVSGIFRLEEKQFLIKSIFGIFRSEVEVQTFAPRSKTRKAAPAKGGTTPKENEPDLDGKRPTIPASKLAMVTDKP